MGTFCGIYQNCDSQFDSEWDYDTGSLSLIVLLLVTVPLLQVLLWTHSLRGKPLGVTMASLLQSQSTGSKKGKGMSKWKEEWNWYNMKGSNLLQEGAHCIVRLKLW